MPQKRFSGSNSRPHGRSGRPFNTFKKGVFSRGKFNNSGNRGNRPQGSQFIHPSKFVNKAVITEEVERFQPEHAFTDFHISAALKRNIVAKGYTAPTPIQDRAIPHALQGQDIVGIANTGTGKTAAFLIPLIDKVIKNPREQALIIVPTRELALQIDEELKALTKGLRLFSVCVVGGASIVPQLRALRYRNQFVIGTPGRLKDLIERGSIRLNDFATLVLDEADRMLDMGFVNDMRFVVRGMPTVRHTLFFSATITREVEGLISEFLKEPVRISVKTGDTSKNVDQDIVKVEGKPKLDILHDLLNQAEFSKVLVFGRTKHGVEKLSKLLSTRGFKTESIHGNKSHGQRQKALKSFKENQVQVLIATDVAARGLDIDGVSHVINYDLPTTYEDYVHRIGRTGRGQKRGKALTFIE